MAKKQNAAVLSSYRNDFSPFMGAGPDTWRMRMEAAADNITRIIDILNAAHPMIKKWEKDDQTALELVKAVREGALCALANLIMRVETLSKVTAEDYLDKLFEDWLRDGPTKSQIKEWRKMGLDVSIYEAKPKGKVHHG